MKIRKRASKRTGTAQREKIKRKVREHHRKSRRDAKKDPTWRTKKKQDPGIPNSFPYKEQLLNEIEHRRAQAEIEKAELREKRLNGNAAHDEEMSDDMEADAEFASAEEEAEEEEDVKVAEMFAGSLKQFKSDHCSAKSTPRVLVTVYAIDARDPASWQIGNLEKVVGSAKKGDIVFALTRSDLVPREQVAAWIAHLSESHPAFAVCSPAPFLNGILARSAGGVECLSDHITAVATGKKRKLDEETDAIAVVGLQNSGRSSLANALAATLSDLTVFDTPALVAASSSLANDEDAVDDEDDGDESEEAIQQRDLEAAHRILVRNAGGIFKIHEPLPLIDALVSRVAVEADLMMAYNTPAFASTNDFLVGVARTTGRLKKGSMPDCVAAARTVLHQWSTGVIGYYAKAPSNVKSDKEKKIVEQAKEAIEHDKSLANVVLPRKIWREKWQGKEIRLSTRASEGGGMLGSGPVAFAKVRMVEDDEEEEDEDEDVDEDFDDEEDDVEEEEEE